ncbi:MAG: transcription-repair coupling factor [Deltaproteobacteria bacterium RIFCSPLOWO2_12_FULL_43_16]|nr:MAG: transcription-repair coupling factor [Deltaproteobacteria bacterium GWA2_43_19]OGQ09537.1 MAG: transcription-repair coupling factor [Deltaproteobacteria bacterium RIFCSPHIGHO2_02_FULL_43_33]OGQ58174.1 MAG: transcription-repair coupling factor [Deltaproteobacteria bacterium RIFCSPLOWO2_12_FULL_43_16]HBR17704.1 transcription-repair coupling factor [Deltaproteobacteria bacterium]
MSALKSGERCAVSGLLGSSKAFFIAGLFEKTAKTILIIASTQEDAEAFIKDINFFLGKNIALLYPSWEILPFEAQSPHPDIVAAKINILYKLAGGHSHIIVTTPAAILQRVMPKDILISSIQRFEVDKEINRDEVLQRLLDLGYSRTSMVEERGEMRIAGGILDIFPPTYLLPMRIEFFGDEVEAIRTFDIASQRSKENLKEAVILPAREIVFSKERKERAINRVRQRAEELELSKDIRETISDRIRDGLIFAGMDFLLPLFYNKMDTLFDYLPEDCLLFLDNQNEIEEAAEEFEDEVLEGQAEIEGKKQFFVRPEELYMSLSEFKSEFDKRGVVAIEASSGKGIVEFSAESNLDIRQDISTRKEEILKPLADRIKDWRDLGWSIFLVCHNTGQAERLKELMEGYNLGCGQWAAGSGKSLFHHLSSTSHPLIIIGDLSSGFRFPTIKLAVITEEEIFGQRIKRREPPSRKVEVFLTQLQDLNIGDFIVHTVHGIGLYQGLKRLKIEDIENDFLILEYQGGDKVYLPVQRLNSVGKYHGVEGKKPEIDKLGSTRWEKAKDKVKKAVEEMAKELLELYAQRKVVEGFSFSKGERLFSEFEASFEYDETPDQANAIEDVLKDMEEPKPMDRLICGDVGYGKTEVAMRAAFKAVLDNKQVAVLVPTTVLAQQHYLTFKNRFAAYPVVTDVLSRFRSLREQKETLKKLATGEVDIIIGTHRLLQKDIALKDLGLIIVDEEHRFGVSHKERLKQMRKQVDVLTLTATPIPRTLHMSLAGIRDLSIINTPPEDRLAIKTIVARFDDDLIKDAIRRELTRGGQVFFVHNRVQSIVSMAEYLKRLAPEAKVGIGHGQMNEKELEKVMSAFINKEYDILLSTSIIESGLDIPSANTILINRADRFGLAEIYQLRGRVGRSSHRAYAYLLTPPELTLTSDAKKRLKVLQELSDLGSGFRLAAYDLEIRGTGELLGAKQSGQIAEVGFEMYTQLLEDAIKELKGENIETEVEPEINLKVSAYIPENYIPDERQRLNIYKRIASVPSEDGVVKLKEEIRDRFGDIPELVNNLFRIMGIKLLLKRLKITELSQKGDWIYLTFSNETNVEPQKLLGLIKKEPKRFRLLPDSKFVALLEKEKNIWDAIRDVLRLYTAT